MWGSSLPNRFFLDLEITFNFSHPCSSIFSLIFNVSILLHFRTLTFLSSPIPSPTTFYLLFIPPPISQFHLTDSYINYYQSYIQCWLSSFQLPVSSASVIHYRNHILYNEKIFHFPDLRKQTSRIIVESDTYFKAF